MYRVFVVTLLAVVACLPSLVLAADCATPSGGPVTLRAKASADAASSGTLAPGQSLPILALVPRWYEVRLTNGQSAFVSKQSTDITPCPPTAAGGSPSMGASGSTGAAGSPGPVFEVHVIDVGTGLSVFVRGPDFSLLYDAG